MGKRATIGKYSRRKLETIIEDISSDITVAGSDNQIQFNNGGSFGAVPAFTWDDTNLKIADDTKLIFGDNEDAHIEYNENGDDFLVISGSSQGIVLSGSTVQIRGTLEGASPLNLVRDSAKKPKHNMKFGDDISFLATITIPTSCLMTRRTII